MDIIRHPAEMIGMDNPITAGVLEALYNFDPIRTSALIDVRVLEGGVELAGNVSSRVVKRIASDLARGVPGVGEVRNRLVADTDIDIQVASAVALDPRTRLTSREVVARTSQGVVHLFGRAPSPDVKATIEEIVRGVGGVRAVVDELEVPTVAAAPRVAPARPLAAPAAEAMPAPAEHVAGPAAVRLSGKGKKTPPPLSPERRAMLEAAGQAPAAEAPPAAPVAPATGPAPAAEGAAPEAPVAAPPAGEATVRLSGKGKKTPPPLSPERRAMLEAARQVPPAGQVEATPASAEAAPAPVPTAAEPAPPVVPEAPSAGESGVRLSGKGKKTPPPLSPERRAMLEELKKKQQEGE